MAHLPCDDPRHHWCNTCRPDVSAARKTKLVAAQKCVKIHDARKSPRTSRTRAVG